MGLGDGSLRVTATRQNFEREPLLRPLGFGGARLSELWQVAVMLQAGPELRSVGVGVQSPLWSDSRVFHRLGESAANTAMFRMTCYAASQAGGADWRHPSELFDALLPKVLAYGRSATGTEDLSQTFALNALVPVDNAAWLLYAGRHGMTRFEDLIPGDLAPALSCRHERLLSVPLVSYDVPVEEVAEWVRRGARLLKIKIGGTSPAQTSDPQAMLDWDIRRLEEIHRAVSDTEPACGSQVLYYLDANGRYDSKDRLKRLLEGAEDIGALERILILEEPFAPDSPWDVSDLPVRCAIDESYHDPDGMLERLDLGYRGVALKPAAKTLSMSLRALRGAHRENIPCFCADLTVNPVLLEWNRNVAARLAPLPGLSEGILECNGPENYKHWGTLRSYHPRPNGGWIDSREGCFELGTEFYASSGGLFEPSTHYDRLAGS